MQNGVRFEEPDLAWQWAQIPPRTTLGARVAVRSAAATREKMAQFGITIYVRGIGKALPCSLSWRYY